MSIFFPLGTKQIAALPVSGSDSKIFCVQNLFGQFRFTDDQQRAVVVKPNFLANCTRDDVIYRCKKIKSVRKIAGGYAATGSIFLKANEKVCFEKKIGKEKFVLLKQGSIMSCYWIASDQITRYPISFDLPHEVPGFSCKGSKHDMEFVSVVTTINIRQNLKDILHYCELVSNIQAIGKRVYRLDGDFFLKPYESIGYRRSHQNAELLLITHDLSFSNEQCLQWVEKGDLKRWPVRTIPELYDSTTSHREIQRRCNLIEGIEKVEIVDDTVEVTLKFPEKTASFVSRWFESLSLFEPKPYSFHYSRFSSRTEISSSNWAWTIIARQGSSQCSFHSKLLLEGVDRVGEQFAVAVHLFIESTEKDKRRAQSAKVHMQDLTYKEIQYDRKSYTNSINKDHIGSLLDNLLNSAEFYFDPFKPEMRKQPLQLAQGEIPYGLLGSTSIFNKIPYVNEIPAFRSGENCISYLVKLLVKSGVQVSGNDWDFCATDPKNYVQLAGAGRARTRFYSTYPELPTEGHQ